MALSRRSRCLACCCLGVTLLASDVVPSARAQAWFTQRTYQGHSSPVINGVGDGFTRPVEIVDAAGRRMAFATRDPQVVHTFTATGLPLAIPDGGAAVTSTINVPVVDGAQGVLVSLVIRHPFRKELKVFLTAPNGTVFTISDQQGGVGIDFDIPIVKLALDVPPGFDPTGAWMLSMQDVAAGDVGQLESFSLDVPSIDDSALIDLVVSLHSNPAGDNNGHSQGQPGSEQQDTFERILQHFADAIYEMTEGRHKIRKVRIFRGGKNFGVADVRWSARGHPHVPSRGGIGVPGGHVNMYDVFENGSGDGVDKDMLADEAGAGYTLAHEWGHYFYGVYDEYAIDSGDIDVAPSVMANQWVAAANRDPTALNFSIRRDPTQPPHSFGPFENTGFTTQHRCYRASCWEVLSRPTASDPVDFFLRRFGGLGPRVYYPELTGAAPFASEPAVFSPKFPAAGRSALDIDWMADRLTIEIVIDRSGSMATGNAMAQAIAAAQLLVNQVSLGTTTIGVTTFSNFVNNLRPLTALNTEADRANMKVAIGGITPSGETGIGEAAAEALTKLLAGTTGDSKRMVFLLSDGANNIGRSPLSVIPEYQAARVPLFTFAFGPDSDPATLALMAIATGGRFNVSPTSLAKLSTGFLAANQAAQSTPGLATGTLSPTAGAAASTTVPVDATLNHLRATVVFGSSALSTAFSLRRPNGQAVTAADFFEVGSEKLLYYDVPNPEAGAWELRADETGASTAFSYNVSGTHAGVGIDMSTALQDGTTIVTEPGPVFLQSRLYRHAAIAGATATCTVRRPDDSTVAVELKDDGVFPDGVADDGAYTGTFHHSGRGVYTVTVQFSNASLNARETHHGAIGSADIHGHAVPMPADVALSENFARSETLQFTVDTDVVDVAPTLVAHPLDEWVPVGGNVSFVAAATAAPAPSFQWQRSTDGGTAWQDLTDGGGFSGVATSTLKLSGVALAQNGHRFRARVSNSAGSITSQAGILAVLATPAITTQPASSGAVAGEAFTLNVVAIANGELTHQWQLNGVDIIGATGGIYQVPSAQGFHAGDYTVRVTADGNSTVSTVATLTVNPPPPNHARLLNLSTRAQALTGDNILIPGFVVSGSGTKRLLIRAVGPTLSHSPYNVTGTLDNPRMALKRLDFAQMPPAYVDIDANDDWIDNPNAADIAEAIDDLFAFDFEDDREAALLVDLAPGQYTVFADGVNAATGIAIVELYDADGSSPTTRLANISNRGFVGTGDAVMIPGFVISSEGPKTLLVRVVGPTLAHAPYNVPGTMADPRLQLFRKEANGSDTLLLAQDNWNDNPDAANTRQTALDLGAFELDEGSADAAFVVTLQPGTYTVVGSSADGTSTGVVLVEVYVVP